MPNSSVAALEIEELERHYPVRITLEEFRANHGYLAYVSTLGLPQHYADYLEEQNVRFVAQLAALSPDDHDSRIELYPNEHIRNGNWTCAVAHLELVEKYGIKVWTVFDPKIFEYDPTQPDGFLNFLEREKAKLDSTATGNNAELAQPAPSRNNESVTPTGLANLARASL